MREFADPRRWIARMSTLVGREDMVGELGFKSWPRKTGQSVKWIFCLTAA